MIKWAELTIEEHEIIMKIVERFESVAIHPIDRMTLMMDIHATHSYCHVKLQELLDANAMDFLHDIGGIRKHLNRETGKLRDGFLPRYAVKQKG